MLITLEAHAFTKAHIAFLEDSSHCNNVSQYRVIYYRIGSFLSNLIAPKDNLIVQKLAFDKEANE